MSKVETKGGRTFEVSQYTFNGSPMAFGRSMNMTYLVHNITDVWSSKCEILQSTNNLAEANGIRK
jgi:hypothetical protein